MKQTRLESLVEVCINVAIGFCVSYSVGPLLYAYLGVEYNYLSNFVVTAGYTILSVVRSYIVRRWFNAGLHKAAVRITAKILRINQ
jgi:hypothetical protein